MPRGEEAAAFSAGLPMRPDDHPHNADWSKRTFDFPGDTAADLVVRALSGGGTVAAFLASPGGLRAPHELRREMLELDRDLADAVHDRPNLTGEQRTRIRWIAVALLTPAWPLEALVDELEAIPYPKPKDRAGDRERAGLELLAWAAR